MLENNRRITIYAAGSRKAANWTAQTLMLSELYDRLRTPVRSAETMAEYLAMKKPQQDDLKDVGGFVAGTLKDGRRKAGAVLGRDALTLDLDQIPPGGTDNVLQRAEGLGCGYCAHSTRKHRPEAPRLRLLFPLDRTVTADEYEPLARKMAELIGMELCDPSTFEASRLMYWPSCCSDSAYVYQVGDKPFLSADGLLALYPDWTDWTQWPQTPGSQQAHRKLAAKQGDPTEKTGLVGAFCRVYDIYSASDKFLPGVYERTDTDDSRLTYTGGSTTGGAVVYDGGKFLFSHHATDPAGGRLCNAWDLVRAHRFSGLDDEAKEGTPSNRLPSFLAMAELAAKLPEVAGLMNKERHDEAVKDFEGIPETDGEEDGEWFSKLDVNSNGKPEKTTDNVLIILENDPLLKGRIAFDEFASRGTVTGPVPWDKKPGSRIWTDNDDAGIRWYLEKAHGITGKEKIADGVGLCAHKRGFDEVKQYLERLCWDGVPRLDTLLIDYLGAADTEYIRAVTRKMFTAAVARVMEPGVKFDNMAILTGAQGIGKSTLIKKMGRKWFSDSLKTFEGKEASELVQGVWLVEIGELEALNKSEVGRIKQFLSQCEDIFRAAYGRHVQWYPRRCVFFGTSNNREYLRDRTGNRRFWPVDVGAREPTKSVFTDLDGEVDQLWAEALERWRQKEPLYLSGKVEEMAKEEQEAHREQSAREGIIKEFLERKVPEDWRKWSLSQRQTFWGGGEQSSVKLADRDRVCALEVWCEAFGGDFKGMRYADSKEINEVIGKSLGWEKAKKAMRFGYCGVQKGFFRV